MQIQPGIRDNRWSGERSGGGEREGLEGSGGQEVRGEKDKNGLSPTTVVSVVIIIALFVLIVILTALLISCACKRKKKRRSGGRGRKEVEIPLISEDVGRGERRGEEEKREEEEEMNEEEEESNVSSASESDERDKLEITSIASSHYITSSAHPPHTHADDE